MSDEEMSAAQEILEYERGVDSALLRFHNRTHWEPTTEQTPLDSILSHEPSHLDRLTDVQLREELAGYVDLEVELSRADAIRLLHAFSEPERATQRETVTRMFQYFCAGGIHPADVLKRVYALGAHMAISPFCDLNLRERGLMFGESHGAQHWRTQRICVDPLLRRGDRAWKAPGQKSLESRGTYARTATGNQNRRKKKKSNHPNHHHQQKNGKHPRK